MQFAQVLGHSSLKEALVENVLKGRVSHAQLFLGPEGSGNLALAIAYATFISCTERTEKDSCGKCPSCLKYAKLVHPDFIPVFPVVNLKDKSSSAEFLPEWRSAILANPYLNLNDWTEALGGENKQGLISVKESTEIIRRLSLKAYESEFRIVMIWYPEKMNVQAANRLLKILEEPGEKTLFLLVAESQDQLLATILSRTQLVKVPALTNTDVTEGLTARGVMAEEAANIARVSDGNFNEALRLMNADADSYENYSLFRRWMQICYGAKIKELTDLVEEIAKSGRERQKNIIAYGLDIVRNCMLLNYGQSGLVRLSGDELVFARNFSPFINHLNAEDVAEELNRAAGHIERNANARILFFDLSLKLFVLIKRARTS